MANFGLRQTAASGSFNVGWNTFGSVSNPLFNLNPAIIPVLTAFTQPLLRGFDQCQQHISRSRRIICRSRTRVSSTGNRDRIGRSPPVPGSGELNEDVARWPSPAPNNSLRQQNQIEAGTVAPVDARAQAELSRRQRDLAVAKSLVRRRAVLKTI